MEFDAVKIIHEKFIVIFSFSQLSFERYQIYTDQITNDENLIKALSKGEQCKLFESAQRHSEKTVDS